MVVVAEEALGKSERDEHELVVVFHLVDGERSGNERVFVYERLVRAEEVDAFRAVGGVEV